MNFNLDNKESQAFINAHTFILQNENHILWKKLERNEKTALFSDFPAFTPL